MIGREVERETVRGLVDAARRGHGRLLLITGEPGIGKTTLLTDLTAYAAERGLHVLSGRAVQGGGTYRPLSEALMSPLRAGRLPDSPALQPFRGALGRLLPGWGEATVETSVDPALVLGEGVLRLLAAYGPKGCVLALEDLHWADGETLALLEYVGGAAAEAALLIAATAREWPEPPELARLAGVPGAWVLPLSRLTPDEVDALIAAHRPALDDDQRELIRTRAEGLPFLVTELADPGVAERGVPRTFLTLVEARLAAIGDDARALLAAAAALGLEPDWDLASEVAGLAPTSAIEGLRRATDAGLLVADGEALRWRHALTRDAVWARLVPPERRALGRRSADLLLASGDPDHASRAADLLIGAGERGRALEVLLELARRDLRTGALRTAGTYLDLAVGVGGGDWEPRVAIQRVELLTLSGRVDEALAAGDAALSEAVGDDHLELCLRLARAAITGMRWSLADSYLARAGRPDDARSLILTADAAHGAGRVAEATAVAERAVRAAETCGPEVAAEALCVQGRILRLSDPAAASEAFARAAQVSSEAGLKPWRVEALLGLGTLTLLEGDSRALREAEQLALEVGLLFKATNAALVLSDDALLVSGPASVEERARLLLERARILQIPFIAAAGKTLLALRSGLAGDVAGMEAQLAASPADVLPDLVTRFAGVRALVAAANRDFPTANRLLDAGMQPLLAHASAAPLYDCGLWALLRTISGDRDEEARHLLRALPANLRAVNRGALALAEAVAAGRRGQPEGALQAYERANDLLAHAPWWGRVLRLFVLEWALSDGWGDPVPRLRADLAAFEAAGDALLARNCRDLLRVAGAATRRGRGDSPVPPALRSAGITSRELDVLRLVSTGNSNAEAAARLFLSSRTVETHVASLLAKTGTANRAQLRAWYARQTP